MRISRSVPWTSKDGCPKMAVRVRDPGGDVPGRDHVGGASVPAAQARKPVSVPVVLIDAPARRMGTRLTGVRRANRHPAGTSRLKRKLQAPAACRAHPAGLDAGYGTAPGPACRWDRSSVATTAGLAASRRTHRLAHPPRHLGRSPLALRLKRLPTEVERADAPDFRVVSWRFGPIGHLGQVVAGLARLVRLLAQTVQQRTQPGPILATAGAGQGLPHARVEANHRVTLGLARLHAARHVDLDRPAVRPKHDPHVAVDPAPPKQGNGQPPPACEARHLDVLTIDGAMLARFDEDPVESGGPMNARSGRTLGGCPSLRSAAQESHHGAAISWRHRQVRRGCLGSESETDSTI